ncbi:MAG: helix-turn-helix transcriptional regulator [Euryarchaeota archaeon]|nr:helix-turn-helix transcriptional regulator [Euryarchaeota archaeon]
MVANISKEAVGAVLMDEYNLKILAATALKSMSVREIAYKFDIPLASAYRKIKELESFGLIKVEETKLTRDGKRYKLYRSQVENFEVSYHRNTLKIKLHIKWKEPEVIEKSIVAP